MSDVALRENLSNLANAMGDECKALRTLINNNRGDLSALTTADKTNLVSAINELKSGLGAGVAALLDDGAPKTTKTWSSAKITSELTTAINGGLAQVIAGAPSGLNTLQKIAISLGNQTNLFGYIQNGLNARVRVDTPNQNLTATQRANARANIGAVSSSDIGPDTDFAAIFQTGLL